LTISFRAYTVNLMANYSISCPHCQAVLKSTTPVPAGKALKCPKCSVSFNAPGGPGKASPAVTEETPSPATAPRLIKWLAVLVGAGLFFGLGGWLLYISLTGHDEDVADTAPPEENVVLSPVIVEPKSFLKTKQPLIVLTPEEEKKVKDATDRAVAYLKKNQNPEGFWPYPNLARRPGATALTALTLLESGVKADDPVIIKAVQYLRNAAGKENQTYGLSLMVLFFSRLQDAKDEATLRTLALRLAAGQNAGGGWTYTCPILSDEESDQLASILRQLSETRSGSQSGTRQKLQLSAPKKFKALAILETIKKGQEDKFKAGGGDNSNTQFALIALWTARGHKVPVDPSLSLVARRFRATQNKDGSFSYTPKVAGTASMTCAGLLGLAVGFGIMEKGAAPPPLQDSEVKAALHRVAVFVGTPREDPKAKPPPQQLMYTMWSLERVAVLYQLPEIEGKRWYHWGMDVLLSHQKNDGSWGTIKGDVGANGLTNTSFALLFLQRINLVADLTDKLRELESALGFTPPATSKDDD
jgi:hypothetical protein